MSIEEYLPYTGNVTVERSRRMEFKWYRYGDEGLKDGFAIRDAVFVKEVGYTPEVEFDDTDRISEHLVVYEDGKAVANARLFPEGDTLRFGRLCTYPEHRGKGYGTACVRECIRKAKELGAANMILAAMIGKVPFYESLGFSTYGDLFYEEEFPHMMMKIEFDQ